MTRRYSGCTTASRFQQTPEIAEIAAAIADDNFRIEAAEDGVHIYNRRGHHIATDAFELFQHLHVEDDGSHAFYLGFELARAHIAWQLGKRYVQDRPLDWGCATDKQDEDQLHLKAAGATLQARQRLGDKS